MYIYMHIYIYIIDIYYYILWIGRPTMVGICNSWEKGNVHADEPPIVIAKPPEVTPKGHTYGFPMLAPSLFSCLALCVHQNPLVGFWVETVHGRHRLMSCDPLADMVKTGQDTRLAEPLVECDHIFENSQYMYIYIYICVWARSRIATFPSPSSQLHGPPDFTEPFICTLFAAFESHNLVIGPCLAVCLAHTAQDLVMYCL